MSDNPALDEDQQNLVRFRRWIAMTPDSKWREFRGTADMVDVGKDKDLVELVDSMMNARISHFDEMMSGWKIMRNGLTTNNAAWIYAEMMQSLASLMKFEMENFSKSNSWTKPKNKKDFPRYLSDCPVRDGDNSSASASGETQFLVKFVPSDSSSKQEEYLKALFGDFVPKQLLEMLKSSTVVLAKRGELPGEPSHSFEGTSQEFLAQTAPITSQQTPESTSRLCTGVGFTYLPKGKKTIMTALSNGTALQSEVQAGRPNSAPTKKDTARSAGEPSQQITHPNPMPPPLMAQRTAPPMDQSVFPPLAGVSTLPPNSNILALMVVQQPNGEMVTMGYVPVNYETLVNPITTAFHPTPSATNPMIHSNSGPGRFTGPPRPSQQHRRNHRNFLNRVQPMNNRTQSNSSGSSSTSTSQPSDSGFNSSGEQELVSSTREITPSIANPPVATIDAESSVSAIPLPKTEIPIVNVTSLENNTSTTSHKLVPSYASIVTMKEVNTDDRFDADVSSTPVVMEEIVLVVTEEERKKNTETEPEKEKLITGEPQEEQDGWQVVKNKHPVVGAVVSSPKKQKKATTVPSRPVVANEAPESADEQEPDEDEARRREMKRVRRRQQRAARLERKNQEKWAEKLRKSQEAAERQASEGTTSQVTPETEESSDTEDSFENGILNLFRGADIVEDSSNTAESAQQEIDNSSETVPEAEAASSSSAFGQLIYSDSDIIKEEIEVNDPTAPPKDPLYLECEQHAKILFRLLWFDNKGKLAQLFIDETERKRIQSLLDMVRAMKDRVDRAGRIIVYLAGRNKKLSDHLERDVVKVARNLIDATQYTADRDVGISREVFQLVGNLTKNFTYLEYVFSIMALPSDFFPRLSKDDPRLTDYQQIITLTRLHMRRVQKIFEDLEELYEFKIQKIPKRRNSE